MSIEVIIQSTLFRIYNIYIFHANVIYDGIVVYEFGDRLISDVMEMKSIYNVRPLRC